MTKEQFMMELEQSLQGEVSAYELSDSLTYYRQYFEDEIRNGKSEEDVIRELGSPRLIARSIIDAHGNEGAASGNAGYEDSDYREGSYSNYGSSYDSERGDIENSGQRGGGTLQNCWKNDHDNHYISTYIFCCVILASSIVTGRSCNYCNRVHCSFDSWIE